DSDSDAESAASEPPQGGRARILVRSGQRVPAKIQPPQRHSDRAQRQVEAVVDEENDSDDDADDDDDEESEVEEPARKKGKKDRDLLAAQSTASSGSQPPVKRKDQAARNAVCFRHWLGTCKFEDCKFMHVNPAKLTLEERAQVLRELPLREFDPKLAEVIQGLNIPNCKDFHQRGECKKPGGRCHFWHMTSGTIARWAGFAFWCDPCSKAFTSEDQMLEHQQSKGHLRRAVSWNSGTQDQSWQLAAGRGGRGRSSPSARGGGRGRGFAEASDEESGGDLQPLRGRGRGRGRGGPAGRGQNDPE
ncbi:unnamed protein product, partial [Polarella glacialis]